VREPADPERPVVGMFGPA